MKLSKNTKRGIKAVFKGLLSFVLILAFATAFLVSTSFPLGRFIVLCAVLLITLAACIYSAWD